MSSTSTKTKLAAGSREMTLREANTLFNAISLLDGFYEDTIVEDPKTGEKKNTRKLVRTYRFGKPDEAGKLVGGSKIRYNGGACKDALKPHLDRLTKERDGHINRLSDGTGLIDTSDPKYGEKLRELQQELDELLDQKVTVVGLMGLPFDLLNLDENVELGTAALMQLKSLITGAPND